MAERTTREETVSIFEAFSSQLDDHNDRRERLIKVYFFYYIVFSPLNLTQSSRDVTNLSKKVIFLLHRIMTDDSSPDANNDSARAKRAISAARGKLKEIQNLFADLKHDLVGDLFWRYQRNVSPGIQEYIEALSFSYYLETSKLISFSQVQNTLSGDDGVPVGFTAIPSWVLIRIRMFALLVLVLPTHIRGLPPWPLRPHRRTDAICHLSNLAKWWPT